MRDFGLLSINRVTAAQAGSRRPRRDAAQRRVERTTFVETKTVNGRTISLYARGGALGVGRVDDEGQVVFVSLERVRTHRNADGNRRYRWYNGYRLPADLGSGTLTVRLHGNDEDVKRRLNRTENVRPIAPTDPARRGLTRCRPQRDGDLAPFQLGSARSPSQRSGCFAVLLVHVTKMTVVADEVPIAVGSMSSSAS